MWDRARDRLHGEIVYPRHTILTEHTLVIVPRNIDRARPCAGRQPGVVPVVEAAQRLFVRNGFRSVNDSLVRRDSAFRAIEDPFMIGDLGGWKRAKREIVEGLWRDRVLQEIRR
mgnify:CR=1 FL=1